MRARGRLQQSLDPKRPWKYNARLCGRGLSKIAHSDGALARTGQPWNCLSRRTIGMTSRLSPPQLHRDRPGGSTAAIAHLFRNRSRTRPIAASRTARWARMAATGESIRGFCRDHHQNKRSTFYVGAAAPSSGLRPFLNEPSLSAPLGRETRLSVVLQGCPGLWWRRSRA